MHASILTQPVPTDLNPKSIGVIILAAGGSLRLGAPKQLLRDADGLSLIRHAAQTALQSACRPVVVVLGASAETSAAELAGLPVIVAVNPEWRTGMASSLKAGLHALCENSALEAVIVMLCDQPRVSGSLLDSLAHEYQRTGQWIAACEYAETVGVPALFGKSLFASLDALTGEEGARRVIREYHGSVATVPFPEGLLDVDTPQDARTLWG